MEIPTGAGTAMSPEEGESPQDACQQQMSASYSRATMVGTKLQVTHRTLFEYAAPVIDSVNTLHLEPRTFPFQRTISATIRIMPPTRMRRFSDLFQNITHHFEMLKPHTRLEVQSRLRVHNLPLFIPERSREATKNDLADPSTRERTWQFLQDSNLISHHSGIWHTAVDLIQGLDSLHDQALAFMHWIHQNFHYQPGATMVNTSLANSFELRAGVCQDFTHVMVALCRSVGIPSRYASGYIYNGPSDLLVGAQASHAWCEVYLPHVGWIGYDPTNGTLADERYVKVAVGRDYDDVAPVKGAYRGTAQCMMSVKVMVEKVD
jgi:transglutaminase-like putative cysteine protease